MQSQSQATIKTNLNISVRLLKEKDLSQADHIMRLAFGTFLGLSEPTSFMGEADYVRTRWRSDPDSFFCAVMNNELVGSNFATNWGTVGFFGPLTIHPKLWDKGIGKSLMEPVMQCFEKWNTKNAGLFTFSSSQKHIGLYQKFGFWPRFLTALLSRPVLPITNEFIVNKFSGLPEAGQQEMLKACKQLTDTIYEGLDVTTEIKSVALQKLGDTVLLLNNHDLNGFAVCHCGPGTEAGKNTCYIKFAAVRSSSNAGKDFMMLMKACEKMAAEKNLLRVTAGVNTARHEAYRLLINHGFKTDRIGVAMQKPDEPGYNRKGVYLIDDWR